MVHFNCLVAMPMSFNLESYLDIVYDLLFRSISAYASDASEILFKVNQRRICHR